MILRYLLVGILIVCSTPFPLQARAKIRMGTLAPKGSNWHQLLEEMGFRWKQATGGEVELTIYAGGIVGGEEEMIRKMRIGQLQAAAISNAGLAEVERSAYGLMVPMMFESYQEWDYVRQEVNRDLEAKLSERGFKVLTWSDVGWVYFFTRTPLQTPEQLRQRRLGASPSEPATLDIMKWAGLNPVPITIADTATGLQTGLIDTIYIPLIFAQGSQLYREARNMTDLRWVPLQGALLMHEDGLERISAEHRSKILEIAREVGERLRRQTREQEEEALQTMKERGLQVWPVDEPTRRQWLELARGAYPRIRERLVSPEVFDKIQSLRDAYRAGAGAGRDPR